MNVLQINKFYHILGGADRYFFNISQLLAENNHHIAVFSMQSSKNRKSKWQKYFVTNVSFNNKNFVEQIRFFGRMIFSFHAWKKVIELLNIFYPDIVHLHSIYHHISPSILLAFKKRNIPTVMTVHDYHLISPNRSLFHNNRICEISRPDKYYRAFFHKCVKNSFLFSFAEVVEKYFHQLLNIERNNIDLFIAPSKFMKDKLIEYGLPREKVYFLSHFINSKEYKPCYYPGSYILYFGRLSQEKGLRFLLKVMKRIPQIQLKIVGEGPEKYYLNEYIKKEKLKNVTITNFKSGSELKKILRNCRFTILSSIWFEVLGLSILESFASGKPVVASKIGGIPEIIKNDYNGFLFKPGDIEDCKNNILRLWNNPSLSQKIGKDAREFVEKYHSPKNHYEKLMKIYKVALKNQK